MNSIKNQTKTTLITFLFFFAFLFNQTTQAQNIDIPDPHFKAALVANPLVNIDGDSEIQKTEAVAFAGALDLSASSIYSLKGIEYFVGLSELDCSNNQITELDLNKNVNLEILNCSANQIQILDLSSNYNLVALNCEGNNLVELNLANGNNSNMSASDFNAQTNALTCIQVDDPTYATNNWSFQVDPGAFFSSNCLGVSTPPTTNPLNQIGQVNQMEDFQMYPNPATNLLTIDLGDNYNNVSLKIYNLIGEVVLTKNYGELQQTSIDLDMNAGVYLLSIDIENSNSITKKLIKE